jgi:hypothetical protein
MVQTIQREFRSRGAKTDRGIAKSLGHGFVIPGGEHTEMGTRVSYLDEQQPLDWLGQFNKFANRERPSV